MPAALFIAALVTLSSFTFGHFSAIHSQTRDRFARQGVGAVGLSFALFLSAMFVFKVTGEYSRGSFLLQLITTATIVAVYRVAAVGVVGFAIDRGYVETARVVLAGDQIHLTQVQQNLTDQGLQVVGTFQLPLRHQSDESGAEDEIDLARVRRVVAECRMLQPDHIVLVPSQIHFNKVEELANLLSELPAAIHLDPLAITNCLPTGRVSALGNQATIQLIPRPLSLVDRILKRALDIIVAISALVLLSPLLLITAAAIKLDSRGPVLFRQKRHGFNNDLIRVLKFRSMTVTEDGDAFRQATRDDPRVTRVGRVLRRSNADELPQLLNVLLGEMSIVGPRPHPVALNEEYESRIVPFMRRHNIKPGITGWAQINGYRGETNTAGKMQKRVEHDLYYIDNWSLMFDIRIILLTLWSSKARANAY
jgi:Undecaprenyl-phosphate glucose phosphotransferase